MSSDPVTAITLNQADSASASATPAAATTAGGLLRQARQARGLHIAALATSIKVAPHKLELLETDRFDELPGTAFTRALAQTVCRFLKIDAAPVMALLPPAPGNGLEQMSRGLSEPFHDRPGRRVPTDLQFLRNPVLLGAAAVLLAAVGISLLPKNWLNDHLPRAATASGPAQTVVTQTIPGSGDAAPADPGVPLGAAVPVPAGDPPQPAASQAAVPMPVAVPASGALQLRTSASSWVEVTDKRGVSLLARRLQAGEAVALDGAAPLRLKIGNASATQVSYNGQPVDLAPSTSRGNVARIELK